MSLPNFLMRKRFCLHKISIHLILRSVNLSLSLHIIVNDSKAFCLHYLFSFICYCLFSATKQWGKTHYEVLFDFCWFIWFFGEIFYSLIFVLVRNEEIFSWNWTRIKTLNANSSQYSSHCEIPAKICKVWIFTNICCCVLFWGDEIKQHVVEKSQMNTITSYKIRITTKKDKEKLPFYLWVS